MEIGVSQSIFIHKYTTDSMEPGYSYTTWDIFLNIFQIFLDVETIFTPLGFQVFLFCFFSSILPDTTGYISLANNWVNNTP